MARVVIPLPDTDFDPTETSVPWALLTRAGHEVTFATEAGQSAACDPLLLTGVVFGQLGVKPAPRKLYDEMCDAPSFRAPSRWSDIDCDAIDALVLPGGHAQGMKPYLDSAVLQSKVAEVARMKKTLGAICHGVLVVARARDQENNSVLLGRRTTCLPKYMERLAYFSTAWKVGRYYRTYDAYVEDEVRGALAGSGSFERGPVTLFRHGTERDDGGAFVVDDGPYVSARWPGDAYLFAKKLLERL